MAEMGNYCKAYLVSSFAAFDGWQPKLEDLRPDTDDDGEDQPRSELKDDDILYLQESLIVTDGIYLDEHVVFDQVDEAWTRFCTETLEFAVPEDLLEPIELPAEDDTADTAEAADGDAAEGEA